MAWICAVRIQAGPRAKPGLGQLPSENLQVRLERDRSHDGAKNCRDSETRPIELSSGPVVLTFSSMADHERAIRVRRPNMRNQANLCAWALMFLYGLSLRAASDSTGIKLIPVPRANLCVTEGAIEELPGQRLSVSVPKMRAYVNAFTPQFVEARFTYLGSTGNEARLGSGELRRQFGLKLRAQDACNLVYAMWRIEPEPELVVSVKTNSGQHTSAECGNRGYRNIKPRRSTPIPALHSGDAHALRAELNGAELKVFVDDSIVWEGSVGPEALNFNGPVGIRSDNARLQIELRAAQPLKSETEHLPGCRTGEKESE